MAENFYSQLTKIGKSKMANAAVLNRRVNITQLAIGDGGGKYYELNENQTELMREVWRGSVSRMGIDEKHNNWIVIDAYLPAEVGGFTIREVAVYDDEGDMIAIGKYPETYKPVLIQGSSKSIYLQMVFEVANATVVKLEIDPYITLATQKDIEILTNKIKNKVDKVVGKNLSTEDYTTAEKNKLAGLSNYSHPSTHAASMITTVNGSNVQAELNEVSTQMADMVYQTAGGTATVITLTIGVALKNGYPITFIAKLNNNGAATTINGKKLYKPNTTAAPNLVAGKAYTVWYNTTSDCFFIKASAEGTVTADKVLAGETFSSDEDTGLTGTMPNRGSAIITPNTVNQTITQGYHSGSGYVVGDPDLIASNIREGKNIFGVIGTVKEGDFKIGDAVTDNNLNLFEALGEKVKTTALNLSSHLYITRDSFDNIFICSQVSSAIVLRKYTSNHVLVWTRSINLTSGHYLRSIICDGSNLYISYNYIGSYSKLIKYDKNGTKVFEITTSTFDTDGNITTFDIVNDELIFSTQFGSSGFVRYYNTDGAFLRRHSIGGLNPLYVKKVDGAFYVYVGTSSKILRLDSQGNSAIWTSTETFDSVEGILESDTGIFIYSGRVIKKLNKDNGLLVGALYEVSLVNFDSKYIYVFSYSSNNIKIYDYDLNLFKTIPATATALVATSDEYLHVASDTSLTKISGLNKYYLKK